MSTSRPISIRSVHSSTLLRPEDAIYSPPHHSNSTISRKSRRNRSSSRRRRDKIPSTSSAQWKKLLWVKQPFPDNYTDEETFLDHLQRNPKLRPYEFWPLVADSTIIVQHLCSVVIFVCCFTGINQGRVLPEVVVGWATGGTVLGWVWRDYWQGREEAEERGSDGNSEDKKEGLGSTDMLGEDGEEDDLLSPVSASSETTTTTDTIAAAAAVAIGGGLGAPGGVDMHMLGRPALSRHHSRAPSGAHGPAPDSLPLSHPAFMPSYTSYPLSNISPRTKSRIATAKSAILIYCSLLGLSPILKSLTKSTSKDSIWAMSAWLIALNVFTFDYGADARSKYPASLSTNAALMASTVLASQLPSTTHVFSLTLFSIEVFGLFPVFRRHLREVTWTGHLLLTIVLVVMASAGLGMAVSGGGAVMGGVGVVLGGIVCLGGMGVTSWWLIGLQRYKNEIYGPWDPARPVIRGGWD